jgi:hypothetical protein
MRPKSAASETLLRSHPWQLPGLGLFAAFLASAAPAQDASNAVRTMCTLVSCAPDAFALSIDSPDGVNPTHLPDMSVDVDGKTIRCAHLVPTPDLEGTPCSDPQVRVSIQPALECDTDGHCAVDDRKRAVRVVVIGTPRRVDVALTTSGEKASFAPSYELKYLNGRECPPPCKSAHARWTPRVLK